jgi:hypothetical protein
MFSAPALPIDPAIRDNMRRWLAHHKRFQYVELPPILHTTKVGQKTRAVYVPHLRRHKLDHCKRYTGKLLRAIEAERGCSKRRRPPPQHQLKIALPWKQSDARVVAFNIERDEAGKPFFSDVRLLRNAASRTKRDKRLENSLTDEQWLSIYKRVARAMFPATDGAKNTWKDFAFKSA